MIGKRIAVLAIISPLVFSASSLYLFSEPNNQFLESITPLLTSTPKLEEIPESPPVVPEKENEVQKTELEVAGKKITNNEKVITTESKPIQIKEESHKKTKSIPDISKTIDNIGQLRNKPWLNSEISRPIPFNKNISTNSRAYFSGATRFIKGGNKRSKQITTKKINIKIWL